MRGFRTIAGNLAGALAVMALGITMAGTSARALPFSYEYTDTVASPASGVVSTGDAARITVTLDNGGATTLSQTWTAADAVSVTFDFNNGGHVTTFSAPFDGGLVDTSGDFVTDAAGNLTSVMNDWRDVVVTADFVTTSSATELAWFLNGGNPVYVANPALGFFAVGLTNVGDMLAPASWSLVTSTTPVPAPGALTLFAVGLAGLAGLRRRWA